VRSIVIVNRSVWPENDGDRGRDVDDTLFGLGLEQRRKVLGDEYVDRAIDGADGFNREFQRFVTGRTLGELRETLVQVTVYAGVPAGVSAFTAAAKVLAAEGVDTSG
jgi:hypothetical protein